MPDYEKFSNFIVFDCANLISRNRVNSSIDNFAPQYIRDATRGVRKLGYDSVDLLKNSAYVWAYKNHDGSEEMKILNDLIEKEKIIVIDVEDDDRMIIEYALAENGIILTKDKFRDHEEKFSPEKWADVKSRMYREFEVIGDKFIAPGLPNRNLTKEQQRKHRDAEKGIRRPPKVENNGSSIFSIFKNLRFRRKEEKSLVEVRIISCIEPTCGKKVKFTDREVEPFTCPHCFTRQDPIEGILLPIEDAEDLEDKRKSEESMKEELKTLKQSLDITERVEKIKNKPKQQQKTKKKSGQKTNLNDEVIEFISKNVPTHPEYLDANTTLDLMQSSKFSKFNETSGAKINSEESLTAFIRNTNPQLFSFRKNSDGSYKLSRKSLHQLFSKWLGKSINDNKLSKAKFKSLIGSVLGQGSYSGKQFSNLYGLRQDVTTHKGRVELLEFFGFQLSEKQSQKQYIFVSLHEEE